MNNTENIVQDFYLKEKLGKGSYGSVYKTICDEEEYAIKQCKLSNKGIPFILEPCIMSSIVHPTLNNALDIYCSKDHVYILTNIAKNDLGHYVRDYEVKDFDLILFWCYSIACAVACLHSQGIIHGDIKGGNVLLYHDNTVKLTDFTLSIRKYKDDQKFSHTVCTCTHRPLECLLNRKWDESLDIWSLGCTFFEIAYGKSKFPYQGDLCKLEQDIYKDRVLKIRQRKRAANCIINWGNEMNMINDGLSKEDNYDMFDIDYHKHHNLESQVKDVKYEKLNRLIHKMLEINPDKRLNIREVIKDSIFDKFRSDNISMLSYSIINPTSSSKRDIASEDYLEAKKITEDEIDNCDVKIEEYSKQLIYKKSLKIYKRSYPLEDIINDLRIKACIMIASKIVIGFYFKDDINEELIDIEKNICHYLNFRIL